MIKNKIAIFIFPSHAKTIFDQNFTVKHSLLSIFIENFFYWTMKTQRKCSSKHDERDYLSLVFVVTLI